MSRYRRFLVLLLALDVLAVGAGAVAAGTVGVDPLVAFGLPLLAVLPVAYWIAYRTDLLDGETGGPGAK